MIIYSYFSLLPTVNNSSQIERNRKHNLTYIYSVFTNDHVRVSIGPKPTRARPILKPTRWKFLTESRPEYILSPDPSPDLCGFLCVLSVYPETRPDPTRVPTSWKSQPESRPEYSSVCVGRGRFRSVCVGFWSSVGFAHP